MAKTIFYFSLAEGCGKSALSVMTAGYLFHEKKQRVLLLDTDPQLPLVNRFNTEERLLDYKYGDHLRLSCYPVFPCDLSEINKIDDFAGKYDYIVVDTPGRLENPDILKALLFANYVITPCEHEKQSLTDSLKSAVAVTKSIKNQPGSRIEKVACMFNNVPLSKIKKIDRYREQVKAQVGYDYVFENVVGDCPTSLSSEMSSIIIPMNQEHIENTKGNGKFNIGGYLEELAQFIGL